MSRILVVDDEPDLVRLVSRALGGDGHEVLSATDGAEGLRIALTQDPDLVVLDLLMPGVGGRAFLTGLLAIRPGARVLILSASAGVGERVDCLEMGAVDFLAKPFAIRELLARVRCSLRKPAAQYDMVPLQVGEISLDLRSRQLHDGTRVTILPQREFLLLQHLMRRANRVCSRAELLSEVWGYTFDPGTNVVDACVARLRSKLGDGAIETVRNVGYQLRAG